MVVVLILIAVVFPITIWLMSRKRLLGLSGLSTEVTATLLIVEERQAKLANILKEIQEEIDYMHTMSAADLKKLIEQAEKYLKQNEIDLERAGSQNINKKV
jgi:molecular chaperone DnaK (HSP70)